MVWRVCLFVITSLQSFWLLADTVSGAVPAPATGLVYKEPFNSGAITQLALGLIVVIGLIFTLAWLLRRYSNLPGQNKRLQVIAALPLTAREKVVLVQAGEQQLLLGVAPGRVNLLASYDEPLIEVGEKGDFAVKLQQALNRVKPQ
ncbi:flagellar biosynthetic protein FliO [Aliamphritea spongicola]|uniref:flagellar biosynthetic protein FliO n=1 Tax=Aliamphritea spongicola TaxID=707589 RepID=UPI00196B8C00|nr:flagellar biosynthetic protein FliO [Aliamphritea spongicola]